MVWLYSVRSHRVRARVEISSVALFASVERCAAHRRGEEEDEKRGDNGNGLSHGFFLKEMHHSVGQTFLFVLTWSDRNARLPNEIHVGGQV